MKSPSLKRVGLVSLTGALAFALAGGGIAFANNADDPSENGAARRIDGYQGSAISAELAKGGKAKNVILLIGDGMGDSEITIARDYAYGAAGRLPGIDALPMTGQYTTYSLKKGTTTTDYVPDSAATGSAWATGTKTYDNAVSVDTYGTPQTTLLELAKANGLKTGNVTTSEIQDATPAVQASHISARSCYGPVVTSTTCASEALENGGLGSITEQFINTRADVTFGGGAATFAQTAKAGEWSGQTLLAQAQARGYQVVNDKNGLEAVTTANQTSPVLGLFASGNLPVRYATIPATVGGADLAAQSCTANPDLPSTQPTLADMTSKAIDLLDNDNGFFLQVEGASIDKQDHSANACGQIGETLDLDEAVQKALEFAKADGNTLVIVTADHAHTSQIVDATTPGLSVNLLTTEGSSLKIAYGTAESGGSQQHTGSQLRVAAFGPRSANFVGLTDQTDTFFTIRDALGLKSIGSATEAPSIVTQPTNTSVAVNGTATFEVTSDLSKSTYQWQVKRPGSSSFADISGATASVLSVADVAANQSGSVYRVIVTNAVGSTTSAEATLTVWISTDGKLAASSSPTVVGTAKVGSKLTGTAGVWNQAGVKTSFQWLRNGKAISGATGQSYTVSAADAGTALALRVTASKQGFASGTALSAQTATVAKLVPTITVSTRGKTATVTVKAAGAAKKIGGTVAVYNGSKVVTRASALNAQGQYTFSTKKFAKGKRTVRVVYSGTAQVSSASKVVKVKITK